MRRLRTTLLVGLLLGLLVVPALERPAGARQGDPLAIALNYLRQNKATLGLSDDDLADVLVTDSYTSEHNGITHIYLRQRLDGIEISQANINLNIAADGSVLNMGNSFVSNARGKLRSVQTKISAEQAVQAAAVDRGLKPTRPIRARAGVAGANRQTVLSDGGISRREIPARLVYQQAGDGLRLAWDIEIDQVDGGDYWSMRVDAASGAVLDSYSYVHHESFSATGESDHQHAEPQPIVAQQTTFAPDQYNVYALPVESPSHGGRTLVVNPADPRASPYGWHDTNGVAGAEYTTTRGNNVNAYEDGNNRLFAPNGGSSLNFDFPINLAQHPDTYEPAAITNLFYWNNVIHDVFYQYGFTEASGNFQQNNYGRGGAGNDAVLAEAQDGGGTNNANFSTPPDGSPGRMQMYLWTRTTPARDGDLDNGIVVHEYGHGISTRLTGGPSNSGCLRNEEQAGEGWSDYFTLMLTFRPGVRTRGVGTYALGQATTGTGIRTYPYSTDMAINRHTYNSIKTAAIPHGVGSVFAEMLWEMTWNLIDQHGYDANVYSGSGGNNIALRLVVDGLKLQPCSPGFVNARDAILLADRNNNGGANQCLIWRAFAKRGLGSGASQGSSASRADGVESFTLPASCTGPQPSATPTRTSTPIGPTITRTRTNTPGGPTATRTSTSIGPTVTRTRTNTSQTLPSATRTRTATQGSGSYPAWAPNTSYAVGARVSYAGVNYQCLQAHTSLTGWEPPNTPALWQRI